MKHYPYKKQDVLAVFRVRWCWPANSIMRWLVVPVLLLGLSLSCSDTNDENACESCPSGLTCDASGRCIDPVHGVYALNCRVSSFHTGQLVSETEQTLEGAIGPSDTGTYELLVRDLVITFIEVVDPVVVDERKFELSSALPRYTTDGAATLSSTGELSFHVRIRFTLCCWEELDCAGVKGDA